MKRFRTIAAWLLVLVLSGCTSVEEAPQSAPEQQEPAPSVEEQKTERVLEASPVPLPEPADEAFVRVADYIPNIAVDLRYATEENFTGQIIYDFSDAYLRYGTVKKLAAAQETLAEQGYGLKIWDAFRPVSAQFTLWEICPDGRYVSNPNKGFSSHSRGNTVDATLVSTDGEEISMPTGFDDFSPKADRDYSDVDEEAAINALLLENVMIEVSFKPYSGEWWHFSDTDVYDVEESFVPKANE